MRDVSRCLAAAMVVAPAGLALAQSDLLPDIVTRQSDLFDNDIVTNISPGRTHLRLSNGTANSGVGKLHLFGGPSNGDGTQQVFQRVYRTDGSHWDRVAGNFVFHPGHNHIHFEDWAIYRLREILPGDGVGPIVAEGKKTSFCIIDLGVYDSSIPGFLPGGEFNTCGSTTQGLSVGWIDIYSKFLTDQNIDITDVPDGEYWLESTANPDGLALEHSLSNNTARVKVTIDIDGGGGPGGGETLPADGYEPNDNFQQVLSRPAGGPNSPNLGPCNPDRLVEGLTVDDYFDSDRFSFYMPATGGPGDYIEARFDHSDGDLDVRLYNSFNHTVATADSADDDEVISMNGRPSGWYTIEVYGFEDAVNEYDLYVNPSANLAPTVTPLAPLTDDAVVYSLETYTTEWSFSDPENNDAWVTIYANETQDFNGALQLPTSLHTPAEQGLHVINTTYLAENTTYWIYQEITDGGTTSGAWAPGRLTMTGQACSAADITTDGTSNELPDGAVTISDFSVYLNWWSTADSRADITVTGVCNPGNGGDGVDLSDFSCYLDAWSQGCP
ncbi:MAG: lysyl oxidase family protein [Planctomycetota bacterium]